MCAAEGAAQPARSVRLNARGGGAHAAQRSPHADVPLSVQRA